MVIVAQRVGMRCGIDGLRLSPALHKAVVLGAVVAPFLATLVAIVQVWQ